jgi:hypothetical protein
VPAGHARVLLRCRDVNARRVTLAKHARKAASPAPKPNRHERRAPLDAVAVMAALADIRAVLAEVLAALRDLRS